MALLRDKSLWIVVVITIGNLIIIQASQPEKNCRAVHTDLNRLHFKEMSLCFRAPNYNSAKQRVQNSSCILKCTLESMGLLNPTGALSIDEFDHYIKRQFPISLQNRANSTFLPCLKFLEKLNSTDGSSTSTVEDDLLCRSYEPYIKCISKSTLRLCSGLN